MAVPGSAYAPKETDFETIDEVYLRLGMTGSRAMPKYVGNFNAAFDNNLKRNVRKPLYYVMFRNE